MTYLQMTQPYLQMAQAYIPSMPRMLRYAGGAFAIGVCAEGASASGVVGKGPWLKSSLIGALVFGILNHYCPSTIWIRSAVGAVSGFALAAVTLPQAAKEQETLIKARVRGHSLNATESNTISVNKLKTAVSLIAMGAVFGAITAR